MGLKAPARDVSFNDLKACLETAERGFGFDLPFGVLVMAQTGRCAVSRELQERTLINLPFFSDSLGQESNSGFIAAVRATTNSCAAFGQLYV